jgi:hypothetical protein
MPEEDVAGLFDETPGDSGPDGTPADQSDIDYEQRYNDLRSEFDRRNQEYSQAEQLQAALSGHAGPEAQAEVLAAYGIELEGDEPEIEFDEPYDTDERIDRLEQTIEEQQAQAELVEAQEMEQEFMADGIEALEQREGREFSDQELATLASLARANRTETGVPDLATAYETLTELERDRQQAWIESKRTGRAPGVGVAASKAVNLDDPEERVKFIADRVAAGEEVA